MGAIIGRKDESAELMRIYNRNQAQLVAVYGRRRVGKTYLIRELFKDKFAFYHTGVSPIELDGKNLLSAQLSAFHSSLVRYGSQEKTYPKDWMEAFDRLISLLSGRSKQEKFVERNGIGYAVDTLDEADKLVQSITDAEYIELYRNVKNIQKLILDGAYTRKTLQDAIIEVLENACTPVQNRYQDHI